MGMFDRPTATPVVTEEKPKVEKYTISVDAICRLCQIRERAESVGFEPVVKLDGDQFSVTLIHSLVSIPCTGFHTEESLAVPTGDAIANAVRKFTKAYVPSDEVKKRQMDVLSTNTVLTVEKVKEIEATVTAIVNACTALASALDGGKHVQGKVELVPEEDNLEWDDKFLDIADKKKKA